MTQVARVMDINRLDGWGGPNSSTAASDRPRRRTSYQPAVCHMTSGDRGRPAVVAEPAGAVQGVPAGAGDQRAVADVVQVMTVAGRRGR